jgi:hypothetical protein
MYTAGAMGIGAAGGLINPRRSNGLMTGPGTVFGTGVKYALLGGIGGAIGSVVSGGRAMTRAGLSMSSPMGRGMLMGRAMRGGLTGVRYGLAGGLAYGIAKAFLGSNKGYHARRG